MVRRGCFYHSQFSFVSLSVLIMWIATSSQAQVSSSGNTSEVMNDQKFDFLSFFKTTTTTTTTSPTPPIQVNSTCKCGATSQQPFKVIDGTLSKQHAWPWVAALVFTYPNGSRIIHCGASVITTKYLLTAAHCFDEGFSALTVILGTNNLNDKDAQAFKIASTKIHPKTLANDIALVELQSRATFSQTVEPICLTPQVGAPFANKSAIFAGWGRTSTTVLQSVTTMQRQTVVRKLRVFSSNECKARYKDRSEPAFQDFGDSRVCAAASPNKGVCQGDSGGPLFLLKKGSTDTYIQIGLASAAYQACANPKYPGIFTRVSHFTKWIQTVLSGETFCM